MSLTCPDCSCLPELFSLPSLLIPYILTRQPRGANCPSPVSFPPSPLHFFYLKNATIGCPGTWMSFKQVPRHVLKYSAIRSPETGVLVLTFASLQRLLTTLRLDLIDRRVVFASIMLACRSGIRLISLYLSSVVPPPVSYLLL